MDIRELRGAMDPVAEVPGGRADFGIFNSESGAGPTARRIILPRVYPIGAIDGHKVDSPADTYDDTNW